MDEPKPFYQTDETEQLKKDLTEFLSFKFQYKDMDLEKKIEDPIWKERFKNWDAIRAALTPIRRPEFRTLNGTQKMHTAITVILPKTNDDDIRNFEFLKGAAYYPFQLEPEPYQEFAYDESCLIQLAFATYYRYWTARTLLSRLDRKYKKMEVHKICLTKNIPLLNEFDLYYELPLPENLKNHNVLLSQKEFIDTENDPKKTEALFDYMLEIARTGQRLLNKDYL